MRIVALEEHFTVPSLVRRIDPDAIAQHGFPAGFGGNLAEQVVRSRRAAPCRDGRGRDHRACAVGRPAPAPICSTAPTASPLRAISMTCWPKPSPPTRIASRALRICRCERPEAAADETGAGSARPRLLRRVDQWLDGRPLSRRSALRPDPGAGRTARRADLSAPEFAAAVGVRRLLQRLAGLNRLSPLHGGVGLAFRNGHPRLAACPVRRCSTAIPSSRLIIGHMGEGLAAMMVRSDKISHGGVSAPEAFGQTDDPRPGLRHHQRHVHATAARCVAGDLRHRSGHVLDRLSLQQQSAGQDFLDSAQVPAADLEKFAHGNADRLLKLKV